MLKLLFFVLLFVIIVLTMFDNVFIEKAKTKEKLSELLLKGLIPIHHLQKPVYGFCFCKSVLGFATHGWKHFLNNWMINSTHKIQKYFLPINIFEKKISYFDILFSNANSFYFILFSTWIYLSFFLKKYILGNTQHIQLKMKYSNHILRV